MAFKFYQTLPNTIKQHQKRWPNVKMFGHQTMFDRVFGRQTFPVWTGLNVACKNNNLPTFYRELLQYFQEFKNETKIFSYGNFLLWNTEAITIEKKMLFWKSWFHKKVSFAEDILNTDGNFLTFEEFQNKFSIKTIIFITFNSWLPSLPI